MSDTTAIVERPSSEETALSVDIERLLMAGDLARLNPDQRIAYYQATCRSLGLNPLTQPFEYINLNGKLRLYARKDCADQLRSLRSVSIEIADRMVMDDLYVVRAHATLPNGRIDEALGAVAIKGLSGEARANAMMKAETKAKRRVTLSICGLGMLDESEASSITMGHRDRQSAQLVQEGNETVDVMTGEVVDDGLISTAQVTRFWILAKEAGWDSKEGVKAWLLETYGLDSSKKIPKARYEEICEALKRLDDEPTVVAGEPEESEIPF